MKLSRISNYALRAVASLASQKDGPLVASHNIARGEGIPEKFLLKVLRPLVSARILYSTKGPNGGFRLAKPVSQITMLEVVEAVDGPIRGVAPLTDAGSGGKLDKRLEAICDQIAGETRRLLGKTSVADLLGKGGKKG
jgi:Rrf2 family protein